MTPERDILLADTPRGFAQQVLRLIGDRQLRARLSANGRELVASRYTWDTIAQRLDETLSDVRAQRKAAPASKAQVA